MASIADRETKHRLMLEAGFIHDEDRGVYTKESPDGLMIQISEAEFNRQYLHQLDALITEREELAKEAFIHDSHH